MPKHPERLRPVENGEARGPAAEPAASDVQQWTDLYFLKTKAVVEKFGDVRVVYAVFMRRPVISAPRLAIDWLQTMAKERNTEFQIDLRYAEGRWVGAGEPDAKKPGQGVFRARLFEASVKWDQLNAAWAGGTCCSPAGGVLQWC